MDKKQTPNMDKTHTVQTWTINIQSKYWQHTYSSNMDNTHTVQILTTNIQSIYVGCGGGGGGDDDDDGWLFQNKNE